MEIIHSDGSATSDFLFEKAEITTGKPEFRTLPGSYGGEADNYGRSRFCCGINPQTLCFVIAPEEEFEAPEAVMTYSFAGFGGMSRQMHRFVREHIVRGVRGQKAGGGIFYADAGETECVAGCIPSQGTGSGAVLSFLW